MLKRFGMKKIIVSSLSLLVLTLLYFIPGKEMELKIPYEVVSEYENNSQTVYLLDQYNYVARASIRGCDKCNDVPSLARDLIDSLIIDGVKSIVVPNGFRQIIPSDTKILGIYFEDNILKIDFSKEFLDVNSDLEEKMIEALTYTLTSIDNVEGIVIYVEGEILTKLPNSKKNIPTFLNRDYGINKFYDFSNINDITSYTLYYINEYQDNYYYVPVTKYVDNENQDKIKVIIEELASAPIYESNLMSFLNVNTKLLDYEITDNTIKLNFNTLILNDINSNSILEEVIYTIGLSLRDKTNAQEIVLLVENQEIEKIDLKNIEK